MLKAVWKEKMDPWPGLGLWPLQARNLSGFSPSLPPPDPPDPVGFFYENAGFTHSPGENALG